MPTAAFLGARSTEPYWRYQKDCGSRHFGFYPRAVILKFLLYIQFTVL